METPQYVFNEIPNAYLGALEGRVRDAFEVSLEEGYGKLTELLSASVIMTRDLYPRSVAEMVIKMQEADTRSLFIAIEHAFKEAEETNADI